MNVTLGRAINLLNSGFSVMPISEGKKPLILWKEYQTKRIEKSELEKLEHKTKGYGIITGYYNVECIDVDLKVFSTIQDGKKFWSDFISFISDYIDDFNRKFVIYKTINSGYHIIYRCSKVEGNRKLATLKGHSQALIETRGTGGYIYIYDNQVSDLSYEQVQEITEQEREILFSLCRYFHYDEAKVEAKVENTEYSGLTPWQDYNHRNRVLDLISNEFTAVKHLTDRIVIRKTNSKDALHGFIYKDSGLCYLFTTATIYPHETPLTPFSIYAYKYFNGDFSIAAKELYKEGYGERKIRKVEIEKIDIPQEDLIFPIDVFPDSLQSYILLNQKTLNHSIDYMGSSLLWLLSLCIGNSCKVEVKTGWRESCNIWIGLIGKAGLGKTPSINAIIFPIAKKNSFEIKHYQNEYKKYKEYEKLTSKDKKDVEEIKEPVRKQLIVNDITVEALADLHEENQVGIAVFKDELNGWIKDMNKYKPGSDLEFWLSCWSNQAAILTRKTAKSSFVASPLIPVLGGIQPGIFSQISTMENKDNGFLDRLLVSYPDKEIERYNKNSIDQEILDWYEAYISQFYNLIRNQVLQYNKFGEIESRIIKFDSQADVEWERIFNNITDLQNSDDISEYVKSMLSKQKAYVPRFALLINTLWSFETSKDFDFITKESLLKAEKLSNYFIAMSKKIKVSSLESNELSEIIRSMKNDSIEKKIEMINKTIPDFNRSELAELLNVSRTTIYKHLKK